MSHSTAHPRVPPRPLPPVPLALATRIAFSLALLALAAFGTLYALAFNATARGDRARAAGDLASAQLAYAEAAARTPWDANAHDRLAATYLAANAPVAAIAAYQRAAALGGWTPARYIGIAQARSAQGDTDGAWQAYNAALTLDPYDLTALRFVAPHLWQTEDWGNAERAYVALATVLPPGDERADAHYRYALLVFSAAPADADAHLAQATADAPDRYAAHVVALRAALASASTTPNAAFRAARFGVGLFEAQSYALAGREFQQAITLDPSYGEAFAYLALCYQHVGQTELGLIHLNRALLFAPNSALVHMLAGYYWNARGQWATARAAFEHAQKLDPQNVAAVAEIAQSYLRDGDLAAAATRLRQATELAPDEPAFWLALAQYYNDLAPNPAEALRAAERAYALAPADPAVLDALGWARVTQGQLDTGLAMLEHAYTLAPNDARLAYHLGAAYLVRQDPVAARAALAHARTLDGPGLYGQLAAKALATLEPAP